MNKKFLKDLVESLAIGIVIGVVIILGIMQYQNNNLVASKMENLSSQLKSSERITDYTIRGVEADVKSQVDNLNKKIDNVPQKIESVKTKVEQTLLQINIMIKNTTAESLGSGATIKYKGKFYVLSAGHMANELTDKLELWENDTKVCDLKIIKQLYNNNEDSNNLLDVTNSNDLLLLKPTDENIVPIYYVELADMEPITGSQIYIVGNPLGLEDILSQGRVAVYKNNYMYFRDSTYFGNSGGGLYNAEGKLIGIMSHVIPVQPMQDFPPFILEGAVRLNVIKDFLADVGVYKIVYISSHGVQYTITSDHEQLTKEEIKVIEDSENKILNPNGELR